MTCPTCGKTDVHTCSPQYDPDLGQFLRTFNVRYTMNDKLYEVQMKAVSWLEAENILHSIRKTGVVFSELVEVIE
jgi:hypothetical protein